MCRIQMSSKCPIGFNEYDGLSVGIKSEDLWVVVGETIGHQEPILLIWINFNPSMDK